MSTSLCVRRRRLVRGVASALLLPCLPLSAQAQLALSTAINRAARFRALSQRVAKAYCQWYLDVMPQKARGVIQNAGEQMTRNLADLSKGQVGSAWPAPLVALLEQLHQEATQLMVTAQRTPTQALVKQVVQQADRALATAQATTDALEKRSSAATARLVGVAGRQRMLSQRMAKEFFLAKAGLGGSSTASMLEADAKEFAQNMAQLAKAPLVNSAIRSELALGEQQWLFFDMALRQGGNATGLETVATTSERLLEVLERLTDQFDAALKDSLG